MIQSDAIYDIYYQAGFFDKFMYKYVEYVGLYLF